MNNSINPTSLFLTLSLRYNPTKNSILSRQKNIPSLRALNSKNFSELPMDYNHCLKKTEEFLEKSISRISEKKIAIGLSGGTDSSLNALFASKSEKINLKLFCMGFGDSSDEFKDAEKIAKMCNADYHEIIIDDIVKDLPQRIWEFGSPKSNLWVYYNFKTVKKLGANATLSGEGGDELFGGYFFRYKKYLQNIPKTPFERAKRYVFSRPRDSISNYQSLFGKNIQNYKRTILDSNVIISKFLPAFQNKLPFLSQIFLADYNYKLRFDFKMVDDIFAKNEKIKIYSPFLNKDLIHFATHIPNNFKLSKNTSKMILRDLLKKLGAPKSIYEKPKQGWGMKPTTIWKQGLDDKCERFLFDSYVVRDNWINKKWIKNTFNYIEKNKNSNPEKTYPYINKIWDVLSFEIFYIQKILNQSKHGNISNW